MKEVATLVKRARDGDAEAFSDLVRRFQDMAVGYGYALLRDVASAEDAAQEAFLEAWLNLAKLREPAAFPGWFRRIVFKQCDRLRRGQTALVESLAAAEEQPAPQADQVAVLEQRTMRGQIHTALATLPQHERAAVVLFYLGGYSQTEMSAFLDAPVTTIKKRLFSARRHLQERLLDAVAGNLRAQRPSRDDGFAAHVMDLLNAARNGDVARVKTLLQSHRRLLTARDWLGNSALVIAVNSGQHAVAELLFHAGVQVDIHEAAAIGQTTRLAALLAEDANRLDTFSAEGFTPLSLAAHYGHVETARYLLERGADASRVSRHPLGVTPLHAALFGRKIETARLLIESGSNVNIPRGGKGWPRAGWTPLHYVAGYGLIELIEPLIARGADPDALDDAQLTPLQTALAEQQHEAAERLLSLTGGNHEKN